jgi:hypothetical protein
MGSLADFKSRLSIFYSDVLFDDENRVLGIASFPPVEDLLRTAIDKLKDVVV